MDVSSMCRICLVQDVTMYCLVNTKLQDIYEKLTATSFQSEDSRPLRVCYMCYGRLQSCHRLHLNCIKSEELLTKLLRKKPLKSKELVDMNTLKIVHPLVQLSCAPVSVEVTHDDEAHHPVEPVDMIHVHVKQENIEDAQDNYVDDEFNEQYIAVTDIVKVEYVTEEDDDISNYGTNIRRAKYNITTKRDEDNIQDTKPDISNVDVNIQNDIKPTKFSDMLLEPIEIVTTTMDLGCVEASASTEKPELAVVSIKVENPISEKPQTVAKNKNCANKKSKKQTVDKIISKTEKVNEVNTEENPFTCDVCGKVLLGRRHLLAHKYIHTGQRPFKCDLCGKSFMRAHHLRYHSRVHTREKPYKCDICEKSFGLKHGLLQHKRFHTGEKPFECDVCGRSYRQKIALIDHIRVHTGEKPYKCDICDKDFGRYEGLKRHKQRHTGVKPYKCDTCGKCFSQKPHLQQHILSHTGEKPHKCDLCKKAFTTKGILRAHSRVHTGAEKPHKCDVCKKAFSTKGILRAHAARVHTGEKLDNCNKSKACFVQKHNLTHHKRVKHKEAADPKT